MLGFFSISWQISPVNRLLTELLSASKLQEKLKILNDHPSVLQILDQEPHLFEGLTQEEELTCKKLIAIGQWKHVVGIKTHANQTLLRDLLKKLLAVDTFYHELGGIVGYQEKVIGFLNGGKDERASEVAAFHPPSFLDIGQESEMVKDAILWGIEALPLMAEFYPLGGAADRLHLVDEETGLELPAAKLPYAGRTLLEGLIRDLSARESLYFRLYGKQVETPIAIMTSLEKNNHHHVLTICEEFAWFGRRKESFHIFTQPLVPAVDQEGNWCLLGPLVPLLKPGGHGALWKLAHDEGVFAWLHSLQRTKVLVRQINNPIAALDYGLLSFTGLGVHQEMVFGFASCPRLLQAAEGVNVVVEKKNGEVALTNIEYCDFQKYGIEDRPLKEGEPYSRFSSNTNILFADITAIERAVEVCPFPGLLVNLKDAAYTTLSGERKKSVMARLESTMQNIADVFVEPAEDFQKRGGTMEKTFVTYNLRNKTIATAKRAFVPGGSLRETPEECFYVQLQSAKELLEKECYFHLPEKRTLTEVLELGPESFFLYHPALGPLYSLIAQKIKKGSMSLGSELQLEISDLLMEDLHLEGSLLISAAQVMGHIEEGRLQYSHRTGRCQLRNVVICNEGVDWQKSKPYWKNQLMRKGSLQITLNGFSEFVAENVSFQGNHSFSVEEGTRMRVSEKEGKMTIQIEPLEDLPFWNYSIERKRRGGILAVH